MSFKTLDVWMPSNQPCTLLAAEENVLRDGWQMLSTDNGSRSLDHIAVVELPSVPYFISILQRCKQRKCLVHAKLVHAHACSNGLESHLTIGNFMVHMFVECGSLSTAQQAFSRLAIKSERSWTSLMSGNVQCGHLQHIFILYQSMLEQAVCPSRYTIVELLKACAQLQDVKRGREIHIEIKQKGFETDLIVGNTLVSMYANCCSLSEAQETFDMLPVRDVVSWTALIAGYAEHGPAQVALMCFDKMQLEGIFPNDVTYKCVLKACGSLGAIDKGQELHFQIVVNGFLKHLSVANSLICMYTRCGSLLEAREVFHVLPSRDLVSWTTLIAGYAEHGPGQEALICLEQMQQEGILPDAVTYACCLKACSSVGAIDKGREIHRKLGSKGFGRDSIICNTLVGMYASAGLLSEAQQVFGQLFVKDVVSYSALIAGYAEYEAGEKALKCFEQMQFVGLSPNNVTYACVLKACTSLRLLDLGQEFHTDVIRKGFESDNSVSNSLVCMYAKCGSLFDAHGVFDNIGVRDVVLWTGLIAGYSEHGPFKEALICFEQMQSDGVHADALTFACILKACSNMEAVDEGRDLFRMASEKGFQKDLVVANAMIGLYAKHGRVSEAQHIFDELLYRDLVSWTSLVAGYAEHGPGQEALNHFDEMQVEGIYVDAVVLACILKACGSVGALGKGQEIHVEVMIKGFEKDSSVVNSLISMYAKCGLLFEARTVFEKMQAHSCGAWSSMIKGYSINHENSMAIQCFEDMLAQGIRPDAMILTCVLAACSHSCLNTKGLEYFKAMREDYGITPAVEHYTCMVDLLAKSGQLFEAEKLLEMFCPSLETTWAALLTACRTFGQIEPGMRCFQELVRVNAEDATWYVQMADVFGSIGSWENAYRVENLRKHAGAKKKAATAVIEVDKKVKEFKAGSNEDEELSWMLEHLHSRIKEEGHMPNPDGILKHISDEDKEAAVCEHAEKLAIAFGILNTPQGTTLRVTKNLRMCNDCHSASKIISRIERREIFLRDNCGIHHFKDGLCSCQDAY